MTHLGHSCLHVEVADQRVLIDPGTFSRFDEQRDLTAIVGTHQHPDHVDPARLPDLVRQNPQAQVLMEPQTADALSEHGVDAGPLRSGEAVQFGDLELTPVGDKHAVIHDYVPRIDNLGAVLRAPGHPSLFHPGDALDAEPGDVDLLAVPINAPWSALKEVVEFVRRIQPGAIIPIHDGLLNETGRSLYLNHVSGHGRDGGVEVHDLASGTPTELKKEN